jgi:hypothetical protein
MDVADDSHLRDFNQLGCLYSLVWAGRALELGLRSEPPAWVGWTGTQVGQVKEALVNGHSPTEVTKERPATTLFNVDPSSEGTSFGTLRLATRYLFSGSCPSAHGLRNCTQRLTFAIPCPAMRNLGFSPGLAPSFFTPKPEPVERWKAARHQAGMLLSCYLFIDFLILPFSFHSDFRTVAGSQYGSLYAPLGPPFPAGIPTWLSTIVLTFCMGVSLHVGASGRRASDSLSIDRLTLPSSLFE